MELGGGAEERRSGGRGKGGGYVGDGSACQGRSGEWRLEVGGALGGLG